MKNAIIVALSAALIFFVLQSLEVFEAGSLVDRNHRSHFLHERTKAVARHSEWLFGVMHDELTPQSGEALAGMRFAAAIVNAQGGLCGRPVRLDVHTVSPGLEAMRRTMQHFCDTKAMAAAFGPPHTASVPSLRALGQFQALPLISPVSQPDPMLPTLEPDTYVSLYPPLTLWANALVRHLRSRAFTRILLLGHADTDGYGWLYANVCEQEIRRQLPQAEVFRFNYSPPLGEIALQNVVDLYTENRGIDAIVFSGDKKDLLMLDTVWNRRGLNIPVYGNDYLHGALLPALSFPLFLPYVSLFEPEQDFWRQWHGSEHTEPTFWNWLGAQTIFLTCRAIAQEADGKGYHPDRLAQNVASAVTQLWQTVHPAVAFRQVQQKGAKDSRDRTGTDSAASGTGSSAQPDAAQTLSDTVREDRHAD